MKKTLKTIQVLAKIARVLSVIVFVFSIVGAIGCLIGLVTLPLVPLDMEVGGKTIKLILEEKGNISIPGAYGAMADGLFMCIAEIFISAQAKKCFKNEIKAGTPFNLQTSKDFFCLGLYLIIAPIIAIVLCSIVLAVFKLPFGDMNFENSNEIGFGIAFLIFGLVCKYGAERTNDDQA